MPQISLSLLGPPLVERDGTALKLDTRKTLALLIYLAVTHRGHRRDSLADLLWPNSGHAGGRKLLRGSLYMLRRDLGGSLLKADRDSIALDADFNVLVDVDRFRDHLTACKKHAHAAGQTCSACIELLGKAAALYRGHFLTGFGLKDSVTFDDWQLAQTESLRSDMNGSFNRLIASLRDAHNLSQPSNVLRGGWNLTA